MQNNTPYFQQSEQEYSSLRKHGLLVGVCLLFYIILQNLLVSVLMILDLYDEFYSNPAFQHGVSIVFFTFGCLGIPFLIMSRRKGSLSYIKVLPFNAPDDKAKSFFLVCMAFAVCIASNYCAGWFSAFFEGVGIEIQENEVMQSVSIRDSLLNLLSAAIAAPLIEEFVFRGVVMQPLRRFGDKFAIVASALLFGLTHASPTNIVFAFISGLAIGYAVVVSKSLWTGIIIHFLNNFFAVSVYEIYRLFPDMSDAPYLVSLLLIFAFGIAGFAALAVRSELGTQKNPSCLNTGRRIHAFFLNIPMVIVVGYFCASMLLHVI